MDNIYPMNTTNKPKSYADDLMTSLKKDDSHTATADRMMNALKTSGASQEAQDIAVRLATGFALSAMVGNAPPEMAEALLIRSMVSVAKSIDELVKKGVPVTVPSNETRDINEPSPADNPYNLEKIEG